MIDQDPPGAPCSYTQNTEDKWVDPDQLVTNGPYILKRRRFKRDLLLIANDYYWSSTEVDNNYTWRQHLGTGGQDVNGKAGTHYVRAIRAF